MGEKASFELFKFILGSEAKEKTKKKKSFGLFASKPRMNFNKSKLAYFDPVYRADL